jgi:hypothetical protein
MVMEATTFRQGDHPAHFRWLDRSGLWAIHLEGQMGATSVIIGDIRREHPLEMPYVEDDDMIEHVATDTPDEPLAVGILPGTARRNCDLFKAHVLDALVKGRTVDRVAISQQVTRRGVPGQGFDDLLGGPLRRWMFRHMNMHETTALMRQHDQDKEHSEGGGWHRQDIAGDDVLNVIVEKGLPRG